MPNNSNQNTNGILLSSALMASENSNIAIEYSQSHAPIRTGHSRPSCTKPIKGFVERVMRKLVLFARSKPIFFLLWLSLQASCAMWGYYYIYISIFPLSEASRKIAVSPTRESAFQYGFIIWTVILSTVNARLLFPWTGPISNHTPSGDENPWPSITDSESNIPEGIPVDEQTSGNHGTEEQMPEEPRAPNFIETVIAGVVLAIYMIIFLGIMFWISWLTWWIYPAQAIWQRKIWQNEACKGWDYQITMKTISYQQAGLQEAGEGIRSNATFWSSTGVSSMNLQHPAPNNSLVTFHDNDTESTFTVQYNLTSFSYSSSTNLSGAYNITPILDFPDLSVSSLYPHYPWTHLCSAPTVAMMDSDHKEIVRTTTVNYDDCTQLKICGRNDLGRLVIIVGAIFIEMEKAGLCCTNPYRYYLLQGNLTIQSSSE